MKQIPLLLLESFKRPAKSTCFLVKIVDQDGVAHGFTTLDAVVPFNDGLHSISYQPDQEMRPQNMQSTSSMEVDNTDLIGWFGSGLEELVVAGKFSMAEITIYRASYLRLHYGAEVVAFGRVGEIEYSANAQGKRKIEFRSLTQMLKAANNAMYSLTCRHDFGDENCGMPFVWEFGTIDEVEDSFLRFKIDGISQPDDYFVLGVVEFVDGPNAGATLEIESWTDDGWLTLSFVTPYAATPGVAVRLRQDCDKTETNCKAYGNIVNMGAEHKTPVQDQSLMVPGAYIKSQNAL